MHKILFLDDNKDLLEMVVLILERYGLRVSGITDWQKLQSSVMMFKPDMIILDIMLGGADGRNLCKKLKTNKETKHIPILLISANFEVGKSIHEFLGDGFITKPFETADLIGKIDSILSV